MGIQYTPVDCMATVFTPQCCNQSARRQSLPPSQRSPVPEPCSYAGAKHQSEVGLSLPNRIRDSIFQMMGTRDKFLAPVTMPQARSTALIEPPISKWDGVERTKR